MKKYRVIVPYVVYVCAEVDAEDREDAIESAFDNGAGLTSYVGNGGSDKLVGVHGGDMSVEAADTPLEAEGFEIIVEEV